MSEQRLAAGELIEGIQDRPRQDSTGHDRRGRAASSPPACRPFQSAGQATGGGAGGGGCTALHCHLPAHRDSDSGSGSGSMRPKAGPSLDASSSSSSYAGSKRERLVAGVGDACIAIVSNGHGTLLGTSTHFLAHVIPFSSRTPQLPSRAVIRLCLHPFI